MEPVGDWMQTATGRKFYPLSPELCEYDIEDIAHALSLTCRFGGHCREFYSVAQHLWYASQHAHPSIVREVFMHDAAEAYCVDLPRALKAALPAYKELEHRIERCIAKAFSLQYPWPPGVKEVDLRVLAAEHRDVMRPGPQWAPLPEAYGLQIVSWGPRAAKRHFLSRARDLGLA